MTEDSNLQKLRSLLLGPDDVILRNRIDDAERRVRQLLIRVEELETTVERAVERIDEGLETGTQKRRDLRAGLAEVRQALGETRRQAEAERADLSARLDGEVGQIRESLENFRATRQSALEAVQRELARLDEARDNLADLARLLIEPGGGEGVEPAESGGR